MREPIASGGYWVRRMRHMFVQSVKNDSERRVFFFREHPNFEIKIEKSVWSSGESAVLVINIALFKTYSRHSVLSLGKILYGTFPCLVVLTSSSKFRSYLYKTKKPNYQILTA